MKNKKDLLGGLIIFVLLLLVLVTYISFYKIKKDENKELNINDIEDTSLAVINIYDDFTFAKAENKDDIDSTKSIIRTYNCKKDDCMVYVSDSFNTLYDNRFIILNEMEKVFIYDFSLDKVVSNLYDEFVSVYEDYYVVKSESKYGLISKSGVEVVSADYDLLDFDKKYESYIKVFKDDLYGVLDLDNGNLVIDTKYKDINICDTKYFSILKDGLWYVIDKNENVLTKGYEYVFGFNKGYISLKDNSLQFLKYNKENEELLNENVIYLYENSEFDIKKNSSYISIEVNNGEEKNKYQYNISRNNLINK